jgi:preprotein translocase subunit SecF
MRRTERIKRKKQPIVPIKKQEQKEETYTTTAKKASRGGIYDKYYKQLLIIPIAILIIAIIIIGVQTATTGDFIHRGVSLKGGLLVTIPSTDLDAENLAERLKLTFPERDIESRSIEDLGKQIAITISADITPEEKEATELFIKAIEKGTGVNREEFSVETIGSTLGTNFFKQTSKALFIAFIFMAMIVFLYFGQGTKIKIITAIATIVTGAFMYSNLKALNIIAFLIGAGLIITYFKYSIPSIAVIFAAFSDIVITVAVVDIMGIKIGTAGIAAFLMLIGYSVDTDILLTTRVLKRTEGSVYDRIVGALKTGMTMSLTALAAVLVGFFVAQSATVKQIMIILIIGLLADILNTWIQNAGILRWHLELKEKKEKRGGERA